MQSKTHESRKSKVAETSNTSKPETTRNQRNLIQLIDSYGVFVWPDRKPDGEVKFLSLWLVFGHSSEGWKRTGNRTFTPSALVILINAYVVLFVDVSLRRLGYWASDLGLFYLIVFLASYVFSFAVQKWFWVTSVFSQLVGLGPHVIIQNVPRLFLAFTLLAARLGSLRLVSVVYFLNSYHWRTKRLQVPFVDMYRQQSGWKCAKLTPFHHQFSASPYVINYSLLSHQPLICSPISFFHINFLLWFSSLPSVEFIFGVRTSCLVPNLTSHTVAVLGVVWFIAIYSCLSLVSSLCFITLLLSLCIPAFLFLPVLLVSQLALCFLAMAAIPPVNIICPPGNSFPPRVSIPRQGPLWELDTEYMAFRKAQYKDAVLLKFFDDVEMTIRQLQEEILFNWVMKGFVFVSA